ncbi:MAG: hydroxymethylbilane synthase, partial [Planctomycetota bacterium]
MTIRLGTRRSALARAQADIVATALRRAWPEATVETLVFSTRGDARSGPLREVGGKGLFCTALEDALRDGRVDLAVHSAKDLPAKLDGDMVLAAVPVRGDPRDALVSPQGGAPEDLPAGARVGTGSPRRAAQLRAIRDDLAIVPLRGNVDTRLAKVLDDREALDAAVLAATGLERLGLMQRRAGCIRPLEVERFVPAAGQGALAVEVHADRAAARHWAGAI